ncbi:MAG: hypothetical protein Q9173_007269, partial [Seirophora scorigena]
MSLLLPSFYSPCPQLLSYCAYYRADFQGLDFGYATYHDYEDAAVTDHNLAVRRGFGKHIAVLPPDVTVEWFKYLYAFEFLYTLCMACVKYSILCFMYRIFPIVQFRRLLKASLYFVIALTVACVFVTIFQCVPIRDFWDTFAGKLAPEGGGRCIDVQLYFIISGAINTFTDFALLALPIPVLWRLKTGKPQKWLLTAIFTVGLT